MSDNPNLCNNCGLINQGCASCESYLSYARGFICQFCAIKYNSTCSSCKISPPTMVSKQCFDCSRLRICTICKTDLNNPQLQYLNSLQQPLQPKQPLPF